MICPKCKHNQIGGSFCTKCGTKLTDAPSAQRGSSGGDRKKQPDAPVKPSKMPKKLRGSASGLREDIPPPPESVQRKMREKYKYKRRGLALIGFWLYNLLTRSVESVLFCVIFHAGAWLLIEIANFFGGMVAPENQIIFNLYPPYTWEYIIFGIIVIGTFRKRWGT